MKFVPTVSRSFSKPCMQPPTKTATNDDGRGMSLGAPSKAPFCSPILPVPQSSTTAPAQPALMAQCALDQLAASPAPSMRSLRPALQGASPAKKPRHNITTLNPFVLRSDRLGTLVRKLVYNLGSAGSWESFVCAFRGRSYLAESLASVDHPAIPLLSLWRDHGVPVLSTSPPWSPSMLDACVRRGCHRSATQHASFLRDEMAEFIESGFWAVLPYHAVRHLPNLQLSLR